MKAPDAFRTISEVAEDLDLPQHVLRFWETRFNQIKPMKRGGGRRYYRPEDVNLLRGIRVLLYGEGFTIRGVQRLLKEKGVGFVAGVGQTGSSRELDGEPQEASDSLPDETNGSSRSLPALDPGASFAADPEQDEAEEELSPPASPVRAAQPGPRAEPPHPTPSRPSGSLLLTLDGRRKIEAALSELSEAQRLLDQVR
jgi:DNA-binding transcriptional MerR regulator